MAEYQQTAIVARMQSQQVALRVSLGNPGNDVSGLQGQIDALQAKQTITAAAAIALSALRVVTLNHSGQWIYADSSNLDHAFAVLGLTTVAISQGESIEISLIDRISDSSWNWQLHEPIYLGSNGLMSQSIAVGAIRQVGLPLSATEILFAPQEGAIYAS